MRIKQMLLILSILLTSKIFIAQNSILQDTTDTIYLGDDSCTFIFSGMEYIPDTLLYEGSVYDNVGLNSGVYDSIPISYSYKPLNLSDTIYLNLTVLDTIPNFSISINTSYSLALDLNGQAELKLDSIESLITVILDCDTLPIDSLSFAFTDSLEEHVFSCSENGLDTVLISYEYLSIDTFIIFPFLLIDTFPPVITFVDNALVVDTVHIAVDANGSLIDPESHFSVSDNCGTNDSTFTVAADCGGSIFGNLSVWVSDINGLSTTADQTIEIIDTISPVSLIPDFDTLYLPIGGEEFIDIANYQSLVQDNCAIEDISFSDSIMNCSNVGNNDTLLITIQDNFSNTTIDTLILCVLDTNSYSVNLYSSADVYFDQSGNIQLDLNEVDSASNLPCSYFLELGQSTWTFPVPSDTITSQVYLKNSDSTINTYDIQLFIHDTIPPHIQYNQDTLFLYLDTSGSVPPFPYDSLAIQINDNLNDSISSVDYESNFNCDSIGFTSLQVIAFDLYGNSDTIWHNIEIIDSIAPQCTFPSDSVVFAYIDSNGAGDLSFTYFDLFVSDNCTHDFNFTFDTSNISCSNINDTILLNVSFTDQSLNTCNQVINAIVKDTIMPNASILFDNLISYIDADGQFELSPEGINNNSTDNCSISSTWLSQSSFSCNEVDTLIENWFYIQDGAGNIDSASFSVTLTDTLAPVLSLNTTSVFYYDSVDVQIEAIQCIQNLSDNCTDSSNCQVMFSDSTLVKNFDCDMLGDTSLVIWAFDEYGNRSEYTKEFTIVDSIAPQCTFPSDSVVFAYIDSIGVGDLSFTYFDQFVSDNCTHDLSFTFDTSNVSCWNLNDTILLNVSFSDQSLNTCHQVISVNVIDTIKPNASISSDSLTVYLDANGQFELSPEDINNNSSDNCTISSTWLSQSSFSCNEVNTLIENWFYIQDGSGNTDSASFSVTLKDNLAPVFSLNTTSVFYYDSVDVQIEAIQCIQTLSDNCTDSSNCQVMFSDSTLVKNFDCDMLGDTSLVIWAFDEYGNRSEYTKEFTIVDSIAPLIQVQDTLDIYLDGSGIAHVDWPGITYTIDENCSLLEKHFQKDTYECNDAGLNPTNYLIASDNSGNIDSSSFIVHIIDNIAPFSSLPENDTVYLDSTGTAILTYDPSLFNDNCGVDTFTLNYNEFNCSDISGGNFAEVHIWDLNGNETTDQVVVVVLDTIKPIIDTTVTPAYFLDSFGQISLFQNDLDYLVSSSCGYSTSLSDTSFNCDDLGINSIEMTVTKSSGPSITRSISILIADTQTPTAVVSDDTLYLNETGSVSLAVEDLQVNFIENCEISYSELSQTTFDCSMLGVNIDTLVFNDFSNNGNESDFSITILDTLAPTIQVDPDFNLYLDENGEAYLYWDSLDLGSYDNCSIDTVNLSQTYFSCQDVGAIQVELSLIDASQNSSSQSVNVHVIDTILPQLLPGEITVELGQNGVGEIYADSLTSFVYGACNISLSLSDSIFSCSDIGNNNQVYLIAEKTNSGLKDSVLITVEVVDVLAPSLTANNITKYLDGNGSCTVQMNEINYSANDNCSYSVEIYGNNVFTCDDIGNNNLELKAFDPSQNTTYFSINILVLDTVSPIVKTKDVSLFLNSYGSAILTPDMADDGSNDNCGINTLSVSKTFFTCDDLANGFETVYLIAEDISNNITKKPININLDGTLPEISTIEGKESICQNEFRVEYFIPGFNPESHYSWQVSGGDIEHISISGEKCYIHCTDVQELLVSAIESTNTNCISSPVNKIVEVGNSIAPDTVLVVFKNEEYQDILLCLDNTVNYYQWGYDKVEQNGQINSYYLENETNIFYYNPQIPANIENGFYYWCETANDQSCYTRSYLNRKDPFLSIFSGSSEEVRAYPNPTSETLYIGLNKITSRQLTLELYNSLGYQLFSKRLSAQETIQLNMSNYESGFYSIRLLYDNKMFFIKIIKE